jgi:hypothetical protein
LSFPAQRIIVHVLFAIFSGNAHGPLDMLALVLPHAISTALLSPVVLAIALQIRLAGGAAPATARAACP